MKIVFRKSGDRDSERRIGARFRQAFASTRIKWALACAGTLLVLFLGALLFVYFRFSHMIDERLAGRLYETPSQLFSAPKLIAVGQIFSAAQLVNYLQGTGYVEDGTQAPGQYRLLKSAVEVRPGSRSYFEGRNPLRIEFSGRRISRIRDLQTGSGLAVAEMEPELVTNLFDKAREKRRPVRYEDLPQTLVNAILVAEDKRFFEHPGFDPFRILAAAWTDLRRGSKAQGASTITMQTARSFFFSTRRVWSRKIAETLMAVLLEHRFV